MESEQCSNDICWSKVIFKWPYPKKCNGKFICKNLKGNICGSYGMLFAHNSNSQTICQERQTISFSNSQEDDQIEIEYWHHHQTNSYQLLKDIQCYLWCSVTGIDEYSITSAGDL